MSTTLADRIKLNLGINHDAFNGEINSRIASGRKELKRLGVTAEKADGDDELVTDSLIAFVCMYLASDKDERALWERSWQIISTSLKDTSAYYEESENNV